MIIKIDAVRVSHELALQDVYRQCLMEDSCNCTQEEVQQMINEVPEPSLMKLRWLQDLYQRKIDFYFELLTNLQLQT